MFANLERARTNGVVAPWHDPGFQLAFSLFSAAVKNALRKEARVKGAAEL